MAELDFPASPSDGQTYTPSGSSITYTYTTAKGSWEGSLSGSQFVPTFATLTATNTTNSTHYPLFAEAATGNEELRTDTGLFYNPSTGLLTTTGITADLTGTFGIDLGSDAEGDTYYRNSSGNFVRLAKGTDNYVMTMNGNVPNWEAAAGGGTITALNNATVNELVTVGATTTELDAESTLTYDASTTTMTMTSSDAGASAGPTLILDRLSATPTVNDEIGQIVFAGNIITSGTSITHVAEFASITVDHSDYRDYSKDSRLILKVVSSHGVGGANTMAKWQFGQHVIGGASPSFRIPDDTFIGSESAHDALEISSTGAVTFSSTVSAELKDFSETVNILGSISGTTAINYESGQVVTATITGATTFTFTNPPTTGKAGTFTLLVTNPTTSITWPGTVDWPGGTAPTLTTSGLDILTFTTVDGGTIWHGMLASEDSK